MDRELVEKFLASKAEAGSPRTARLYRSCIHNLLSSLGQGPVTPDALREWAYSPGPSGRRPSPATVEARLAAVSSYYRWLARQGIAVPNPADAVDRPRAEPAPPKGLSREQVKRLLSSLPDDDWGKRTRAVLLFAILTGRRVSEIVNLRVSSLEVTPDAVYYTYTGKGGKRRRRELPPPVLQALNAWRPLAGRSPDEPLFAVMNPATLYRDFQMTLSLAGLPRSTFHSLRHTAAKLRREAGASLEEVSDFLDHSNLAITHTYLRRLEGVRDQRWQEVAKLLD